MMGKGQILAGPSAFLLLLFLLPGDNVELITDPEYLVLVPFVMQAETTENICVHLRNVNGSATVHIGLEERPETKISHVVSEANMFQCIPFRVPKWSNYPGTSEASLAVTVQAGMLALDNREKVLIRTSDSLVFVQTDKPLYKPGQKVQFRIISVDEGFRPMNETFPLVYIQDPKRYRLQQWTNVEQKMGLVQLSFPLSSEPPQGTYKVVVEKASGNKVERSFEVKEYVLPKYEVLVKAPKEITFQAEELEVNVCGLYTYGKPVAGQVKIRVCQKYNAEFTRLYRERCHGAASQGICGEFSGEANGQGCLSQVVKMKGFHLNPDRFEMSLKVEGTIAEEGTGVELTGEASIRIIRTFSTITFEKVDSHYKSGIPFTGQVKLMDAAKVPIANETIQISEYQTGTTTDYITDDQGRAQFSIDTDNFTGSQLQIEATCKPNSACERHFINSYHRSAFHSAWHFYSPSQSYVHIERVPGPLSCGQTQTLRVHYILNSTVVKEPEVVFYYLVSLDRVAFLWWVELTGEASIRIIRTFSTITFEKVDSHYKSGIPFTGQVKLMDAAKVPIANETIQISEYQTGTTTDYITDDQGRAQFSIDTDNFTGSQLQIEATCKPNSACERHFINSYHRSAFHSAWHFYSPSQSYVHIERVPGPLSCGQTQTLRVHYILNSTVVKEPEVVFYYLVMSKGNTVRSGTHILPVEHREGTAKGVFSLDLSVNMDFAPLARLLLYTVLPSEEVVAHSADFTVENCFANKVNLRFSDAEGLPASKTHVHLAASKGSLCAVHAVDKSVFLLKPEAQISPKTVYDLLPVKNLRDYVYRQDDLAETRVGPCMDGKNMVVGDISDRPFNWNEADVYDILKDFGVTIISRTLRRKPFLCRGPLIDTIDIRRMSGAPDTFAPQAERTAERTGRQQETVRSYFPETWLWNTYVVNDESQGEIDIPVTIPDTITEWKAGAFCLSPDVGFGLAQTASLTAFQPFFLDLTLPYSVVRGEAFTLKATVFTYMQRCIRVSISLAPSAEFVATPLEKEEESYCLCADERKTVSWTVTPKSLGEINFTASAEAVNSEQLCGNEIVEMPSEGQKKTMIKSLLVEQEGVERDVVFSNLLCAAEKSKSSGPLSLKLPDNVVEGSARASFCVLGDLLGIAIQNLHKLLRMPYGTGEQNLALFVPNIYILEYLNKTEQLTEEVKTKAIGYLVAGYQRQLKFKGTDGSYSTFGQYNPGPGNTWLTAFTLKSFSRARPYIFVDEKHIQDAQAALAYSQKENGCFHGVGTLGNNRMKGGVDDETTLTAYITAAFLESGLPLNHPTVHNALFCLEKAAQVKEIHVYTLALLAYSFALAEKEELRQKMLLLLHQEAVQEEDGSLHWKRPGMEDVNPYHPYFHRRAPSAEVEMAAYVLLSYLTNQPAPSQEVLGTATRIVKWLSRQQNPTGGFSSTQDTVVALQALTLYGSVTYSKSSTGTEVTLSSTEGTLRQFQVDSTNRLLLQCQALPRVPGDYDSMATGEGCVHVQTTLKYNVQPHQEEALFMLEVNTVPETCTGPKANRTFDVAINVSYTGSRPASNMAIVDVKMLSGFVPVKSSVKQLESHNLVRRTEVSTSHVLLYLEKVTNMTQSYTFTVEQDVPVQNLKPAVIRVYDYYETDEGADAKYIAPCNTGRCLKIAGHRSPGLLCWHL
ncbi:alpha-2-macroglobulin-like [Lacerta agilis]|uniref:alpha-2-macroglobulin-like n=1 Tax=Lacerta agilis TaxID=80427 RepID=UPI001419C123|nr:alpha-2-macroglobulin-like [Lacerta agilis]